MDGRILMQASGAVQPLRFAPSDRRVARPGGANWPGLPIEVLPMGDWEGEAEVGPLRGAVGIMVYLQGQVELLARGPGGRDRVWVAGAGDVAVVSGDELTRVLRCRGRAQVAAVDLSAGWLWAAHGEYRPALSRTPDPELRRRLRHDVAALMRCSQAGGAGGRDRLEVEDASFQLLSDLLQAAPAGRDVDSRAELSAAACGRLREYVLSNLDRPVAHGDLASVAGLPPRSFSKAFKRAFRTTPYQYVLALRLGEAARLMRTTRRGLAEIAYELGFSSQSHFSTAFRRAFHVAPRDYIRAWRTTIASRTAITHGAALQPTPRALT